MSQLYLQTANQNGRTVIVDSFFTSPIKIAKPFYRDHYTEVMMMTASAGILEGDFYDIELKITENSSLKFTAQSYTKIFKSEKSGASQRIKIDVSDGGELVYLPCPVIPFAGSVFDSSAEIRLSKGAKFAMCDVVSCGRAAMNEKFMFTEYRSRTAVSVDGRLKFLDNIRLAPHEAELAGIGFFEGYTHQGMIYLYGYEQVSLPSSDCVEAALTQAAAGICVRMAGNSGEDISNFANQILCPHAVK